MKSSHQWQKGDKEGHTHTQKEPNKNKKNSSLVTAYSLPVTSKTNSQKVNLTKLINHCLQPNLECSTT